MQENQSTMGIITCCVTGMVHNNWHVPLGNLTLTITKEGVIAATLEGFPSWIYKDIPAFMNGKEPVDIRFTICQRDREKLGGRLARLIVEELARQT